MRPMFILSAAGMLNFLLNLLFVVAFHLDAAGVALATILSNYASAAAVLWFLFSPRGDFALKREDLKLHTDEMKKIASVGLPCGLNGMVFSLSNVIIVTALNSLGETVLAANSAAHNIDALYYQVLAAFSSACVSFAGQNFGAKKLGRIDRCLGGSILLCGIVMILANAFVFSVSRYGHGAVCQGCRGGFAGRFQTAHHLRLLSYLYPSRNVHRLHSRHGKIGAFFRPQYVLYLCAPCDLGMACISPSSHFFLPALVLSDLLGMLRRGAVYMLSVLPHPISKDCKIGIRRLYG